MVLNGAPRYVGCGEVEVEPSFQAGRGVFQIDVLIEAVFEDLVDAEKASASYANQIRLWIRTDRVGRALEALHNRL